MATKIKAQAVTAAGRKAAETLDFSVFTRFARYGRISQKAISASLADKIAKTEKAGLTINPEYTGGVWVPIGGGKYIFIRRHRPIPPRPNPLIKGEELIGFIIKTLKEDADFKTDFSNSSCCGITVAKDGKNILSLIVFAPLS